jgi:hypothetical protein
VNKIMVRGFKTSEARLAVAVIVGEVLAAGADKLPSAQAGWVAGAVAIAYAISRGFVKHGGAEAFPALAEKEH